MFRVKKRSTHNLLRNAKKMIQQPRENLGIRINKNKRNREVPEYVDFSPRDFMAWWITATKAKRKASNYILHYMKFKFNVDIPTDYRTLLHTPKTPIEKLIHPGSYIHVGVRLALIHLLTEARPIASVNILMQFFIDGLSVSRSTKDGFWIIMMNIRNVSLRRLTPKVIGVYYGDKKVENFNEFLWAFVMELNDILEIGIVFDSVVLMPTILNFVLDAPSRTSCKAVKAVTGYFGCDVCTTEGVHIHNRTAFLDLDAPLRNDDDFRARKYDDYHHMESVLEMLPIDMILAFPLDYLHCVLLGVIFWILKFLRDTPKTLSSRHHIEIKRRIDKFEETRPKEFEHILRSFVDNLGLMKGTEFRQYLLFVGPLLLKDIVEEEKVNNLMKLHIASTIFSHKRFAKYYDEANTLMRMFIVEFAAIYHPCHVNYVNHSLCHMKIFIDLYGAWDNFSTFEYESHNSTVKNLIQGNVMPLTQVTNRIVEIYNAPQYNDTKKSASKIEISDEQEDGSFANLKYYDLCFRVKEVGQNFVLLKDGRAVKLVSIFPSRDGSKVKLIGKPFKQRTSVYNELIFSGEYTKAMNQDWHSGHFCCWQCDESLTGQRYVLRDEHPYCIKCYENVFANTCDECNKIIGIDSKDLSYKEKHWHEACFLCNKCRVSLVDKQFGSKAEKIYCGNCYDSQFASRCDGCGEVFRAGTKKMEYKTRQWHEKCFSCCVCKNPIGTKSFIPKEQEIYCAGCYEEKYATRCIKCSKIITSGGVTYKNDPWHRECFTCTHCSTSLAGQRFTSRDDKPYCADCFSELFAKRCTSCTKPITGIGGTRFISFEDRHWHNDCFICASCKTSLVGRGFITDEADIICPECAKARLM